MTFGKWIYFSPSLILKLFSVPYRIELTGSLTEMMCTFCFTWCCDLIVTNWARQSMLFTFRFIFSLWFFLLVDRGRHHQWPPQLPHQSLLIMKQPPWLTTFDNLDPELIFLRCFFFMSPWRRWDCMGEHGLGWQLRIHQSDIPSFPKPSSPLILSFSILDSSFLLIFSRVSPSKLLCFSFSFTVLYVRVSVSSLPLLSSALRWSSCRRVPYPGSGVICDFLE